MLRLATKVGMIALSEGRSSWKDDVKSWSSIRSKGLKLGVTEINTESRIVRMVNVTKKG